jgi:hypothetical protein
MQLGRHGGARVLFLPNLLCIVASFGTQSTKPPNPRFAPKFSLSLPPRPPAFLEYIGMASFRAENPLPGASPLETPYGP